MDLSAAQPEHHGTSSVCSRRAKDLQKMFIRKMDIESTMGTRATPGFTGITATGVSRILTLCTSSRSTEGEWTPVLRFTPRNYINVTRPVPHT